ncbi:acyltransferase [Helicobacter mustelae]|uniref:Putative acyltransferase n=1 Tax=Helicobacter mustelae (strain ATCC 43772 / CCUG 25715 / CIP 103759 / LMG 18044 / NCTC 12198 / R85-136P) TaxID=679897 RepID=D3UGT7_HELM1|nr:acyltransferase [Helicobacter mustelae]CBG39708.1 putative acyltransferase [Helicobacter mustelae 12198]SQH71214.1 acyltransferase [Helicobacter mustelae]STP12342.1 acyltransferase [Helicobacter mustelae]
MRVIESGLCDVRAEESVTVMMPSNLYGCRLMEDVFIGPFVEVQCDVVIGARTRVQSHSFICSLVEIGEDCFIGHGVMFINDTFLGGRLAKENKEWKKTRIGNRVLIGSNATILPVYICDDVAIGAGSVVVKDITESGIYAGNPARKIKDICEKN